MKHIIDLLGRIFVSIIFFYEAYDTINYFADTHVLLGEYGFERAENFLIVVGIVLLTVGATLILIGYRVALGCIFLLIYMVPVTFIVYSFWNDPPDMQRMNSIIFMKNIAIIGALLLLSLPSPAKYRLRRIFQAAKLSKPDWSDTQ